METEEEHQKLLNSSNSSITALVPGGVVTTQNISTVIRPKGNINSLQFVKIQTPELSKMAVEQIRIADETKISKEKIKEVEEEWQNNLLNWKSKRRQQLSHSVDYEPDQSANNNNDCGTRKVKTFAEMIEQRAKSGNRLSFHLQRYASADDGQEEEEDEEEEEEEDNEKDNDEAASSSSQSSAMDRQPPPQPLVSLTSTRQTSSISIKQPITSPLLPVKQQALQISNSSPVEKVLPSTGETIPEPPAPASPQVVKQIQQYNKKSPPPSPPMKPILQSPPQRAQVIKSQAPPPPLPPAMVKQTTSLTQAKQTLPPVKQTHPSVKPAHLTIKPNLSPVMQSSPSAMQIPPPMAQTSLMRPPSISPIIGSNNPSTIPPEVNSSHKSQQKPSREDKDKTVLSISGKKRCSSCKEELGRGAAAFVVESLSLVYHTNCFRCSVCHMNLSNGFRGVDVRVHAGQLHCQNCYSKDGLSYSRV